MLYQDLFLVEPSNPQSWMVKASQNLAAENVEGTPFFEITSKSHEAQLDFIFVSIAQDAAGRHQFINLGEAKALMLKQVAGEKLHVIPESEVKTIRDSSGAVLLYAQAQSEAPPRSAGPQLQPQVADTEILQVDDLCPHASIWATNYSVIPELTIGYTQRLILCNESTLTRTLPGERIFDHLRLIVNCHESQVAAGKYKVGCCMPGEPSDPVKVAPPSVICHAVHQWHSDAAGMNQKNDQIQAAIWAGLQQGTVAVHCMAGIHRAACIVACHFLYRHYALGHDDVCADTNEIYRMLQATRPSVSPAYTHVLKTYEAHLKAHARASSRGFAVTQS